MKTIKTASSMRKIEDWNNSVIPIQLKTILQEQDAIDNDIYRPIFDAGEKNEFTSLDNTLFYSEMHKIIKATLYPFPLFEAAVLSIT